MEIFIFIFGLIMGSFYNVVGLRLPNGESIIKPRSHCPKCEHQLNWYENIPVISYLFLKGRCKICRERISFMYPAMELLCALLFLFSYLLFGISEEFFIALVLSSLVVIIFVSDTKYMIILDSPLVIGSILILIIKVIYEGFIPASISLGYGMICFILVYLLMLLGNFLFKKESLGGGDIKLSFVAGLTLGPLGIVYLVLGSFLAFPYAVYITLMNKDSMLPFGPFLVTSLFLIYLNFDTVTLFIKTLLEL